MKKDINGRQVVREALRITTLVQMGAYIGSTRWLQRVPPAVPAVPAASDPLPAAAVAAPAANTASRIALRGWKDGSPLPPRHGGSSRPAPSTARHGTPFAPTRFAAPAEM